MQQHRARGRARCRRNSALRLKTTVAAAAAFAAAFTTIDPSHGAEHRWIEPNGGSYGGSYYWDPAVPPGSEDDALFDLLPGGYVVTWTNVNSTITNLMLKNGAVTFMSNGAAPSTYTVTGSARVQEGATLYVGLITPHHLTTGPLVVRTGGTLNIRDGSHVTASSLHLGRDAGAAGAIIVNDPGSSLSVADGPWLGQNGATGSILLTNSATASFGATALLASSTTNNSKGLITVQGGAALTLAGISAGAAGRAGQRGDIELQGSGSSITQTGSSSTTLGAAANSAATLNIGTISGNASTLFTTGTGTLRINPTGQVNIGGDTSSQRGELFARGNILLDGGTLNVTRHGTLNQDYGKSLTFTNGAVGNLYGVSTSIESIMSIQSGSAVYSASAKIGDEDDTHVTVTGHASHWELAGLLDIGPATASTLTIADEGRVLNLGADLGFGLGGSGSVIVRDLLSNWTSSGTVTVGYFGAGNATVQDGAGASSQHLNIARQSGSAGAVTVTGASSYWSTPGSATIGVGGDATLELSAGGSLHNHDGHIAFQANSSGIATVGGTNTRWNNAGDLTVGYAGDGQLNITAGGAVSSVSGFLARSAGATAAVDITGPGAGWWAGGSVYVGGTSTARGGTADVTASSGGMLSVEQALHIWDGSSVHVGNNGVLLADSLTNKGVLTVTGDARITQDVINDGVMGAYSGGEIYLRNLEGAGAVSLAALASLSADRIRQQSVTLSSATLRISSVFTTSRIGVLENNSGFLDLGENRLIVAETPIGNWNGSAYTGITGQIQARQIGAAQIDANDGPTAIGVATAADLAALQFGGLDVEPDDVLVMYTYRGDATLDGMINIDDYGRIDANIGTGATGWFNGDFNYDGSINIDDYGLIDANITRQGPPFPTSADQPDSGLAAVPEPTLLPLALLAPLVSRLPRRRKTDRCSI